MARKTSRKWKREYLKRSEKNENTFKHVQTLSNTFKHFQERGGTKCPQCRSEYALRVRNWMPPGQPQQNRRPQSAAGGGGGHDREMINRMANMERMFMHFMDAFIPGEN